MKRVFLKAQVMWGRAEAPILLIGVPASLLIWAYSNFATVLQLAEAKNQIIESKAELRAYVDQKHAEVSGTLDDIKQELGKQRSLQEKILLRVSN